MNLTHFHNAAGNPVAASATNPLPTTAVLNVGGAAISTANPVPVVEVAATPAAGIKATFVRGIKAPAATTAPEALAATGTFVRSVTIYAGRTGRAANAGIVYLDSIATDDAQRIALAVGGSITLTAPPGKVIDLADLYVDAVTLTDGVYWLGLL